MLFSLFFASFEVDITWLDEIAEGLKHMTTALNNSILNLKNIQLDSNPDFSLDDNKFVVFLQKVLRQISYTIGWVAGRLIQRKQNEEEDATLSKLNVLQGGIENRFIPGLSDPTKIQIEGSFKITGDKQLQKLALSDASTIVLEMEDKLFKSIVDNEDSVKLILQVLHQSLLQKVPMCAFARLGGEDGATISRAAFAVIIKFTDKTLDFEGLNNQIETIASDLTTTGVQKLKEIINQLKEQQNEDYETLCKSWETANQMRKWTQQIKLTISENIKKQIEEVVRNEINEANPSAEPFTGPFTDEQKQIVEERSNAKFDLELQKTYQGVVDKTRTLLKLQVPAQYKQKREIKHAKPSLQSIVGNKLMTALSLKRKQSVIMIDRSENKTDKEYDWTDRLKQWKNVQMAQGAIVDLGSKGQLNSQSASLAILGLLQSEFTVDQINKTIEESLINGLRRSAGLNLLNYAMGLLGNSQIFFDMIQWFSASLRQRKNTSVHFLDGLTSCGNSCESGIRVQFFKILKKVDLKLRTCNDLDELKLLLNVLCWNFTADDHEQLSKLNIFDTLHKGDGSDLSWVKYNLGTYMYQCWNSKSNFTGFSATNIGRALQQTSEYLQNQVLASIIQTQNEVEVIESKQSQAKMITAQTTLDENASKIVVEQLSSMVWSNIDRTVSNNRNQPCADRNRDAATIQQRFNESEMLNQDSRNTNCSVYADCLASRPHIKTLGEFDEQLNKRKKVESIKMRMLINLVDPSKNQFGVNVVVENWLKQKAGPALGLRHLGQIIDHVKACDLIIQELLQRTTFEELGLKTPKTDEEKAAEAAAKAKEEAEIAAAKAKAEAEEAEAIAKAEAREKAEAQGEVIRAERQARADAGEATEEGPVESAQSVSVPEAQDVSAYITEKNCDACTFINSVDAVKCSCCETPFKPETIRPVPIPPVKEEVKAEEISEDESQLNDHQKICRVIGKIGKLVSNANQSGNHFQDFDKRRYFARGPQFRFLMQLEQLLGVAEKSAVINSLIQDSLHPEKIKLLIELFVSAHPTIGQLVQRIFQILLRMEVPQEIFESAIAACCIPDAQGNHSEVEKLLSRGSVLSFPQSKFLQLLVNSVQSVVEKTTKFDSYAQFDFWHTAIETTRTLRVLQTFPNKNQALGNQFKAQISEAMLSIETKTDGEVETLINLIGEMRIQNHFNIGQAVQNDEGDLYIVVDNEGMAQYQQQSRRLTYFDPQQPARQQFVDGASDQVKSANKVSPQKLTPILDLNISETEEAARNSVLVQPEVISKLLDLLKDSEEKGIGSLSNLTVRSLQTSITRGFMNLFKSLKLEYMQLLKNNNLFEKLISYFVHVSGESSFPFADQLRDLIQKEQHLQFRKQSWTSKGDSQSNTSVHWVTQYISDVPSLKEESSFNEEESKSKLPWTSSVIVQNLHGGDEGHRHYVDFQTIKETAKDFTLPEITEIGIWYESYVNGVSVFYKDGTSYERKGDSYYPGTYQCLKMMKGEFVSMVHGRFGCWGDQLTIYTNYGRKLSCGGMGGGEQAPVYPKRTYVVGLDTHFHNHLTRVEVQYVDLDQLPWAKEDPLLNMRKEITSAIIQTSVLKYDSKKSKVTRDFKFDLIKFKENYFRKNGKSNNNRSDSIISLTPDSRSYFFDHIEGVNKLPGVMMSSETLRDMTPQTFYLLGGTDTIFTDDLIPIEDVLQKMHDSLAEKKEEFKNFDRSNSTLADPYFIVLAKADFDSLKSSVDNTFSGSAESSKSVSTDEKCLFLNDISHRICVSMEKNDNSHVYISSIAQKIAEDYSKTVAEIVDLCIEDNSFTDEVKTLLRDVKDGVAFVPPVTEEKIEDAQDNLLTDQISDDIPNFSQMLLKSEEVTNNCANELINQQYETSKYLDEFGSDFYGKEMGDQTKCRQQSIESLQQIYNLYKVVNQSICRNTLINIMEVAGNRINESAGMLLQQEELLTKLDDLLHNEHMVRSHQSFCYEDPKSLKKSEEQTINVLRLFKETPSIKNFLVKDFFKRAKETILKISKDDFSAYFQTTPKLVTNFRSKLELEAYLDPMNLALLSTQFIEQNFINEANLPEALIAFIDLDLVYAMILNRDQISKVSVLLLKLVKYHIKKISDNLDVFKNKTDLIQRLFTHGLLKTLISKITNFSSFKQNPRWLTLLEITNQIMDLKIQVFKQLGEEIAIDLGVSEEMQKYFTAIHVLKDGAKFSTQMSKIKFATLLNHGDPQISHLATSYSTANKRFVASFEKKFGPEECNWTFKISKMTSPEFLHVSTDDGRQIMLDRSSRTAGAATSINLRAGQSMTIRFPVKPQVVRWTGFLKSRRQKQDKLMSLVGYTTMMETASISPVNVLGAQDHLTFVAADCSVYGMGGHVQAQDQGDSECFRKIPFPEGLSGADIKKITVGKMGRVILTNDGRFFYNGRNRYYTWGSSQDHGQQQLDQFMEKDKNWFRNGDDKIVDIVSGCHYVVVLTEAGKIHCQGYRFYRNFEASIRHNNENYEDWPFYLDTPAGWTKAVQAFPAYKNNTVYVNLKKDDGSIGSFRVGQSDQDDGGNNGRWHWLLANQNRYFKKIVSVWLSVWGICDEGNLWIWGKEIDDFIPKAEGVPDCLAGRFFRDPVCFTWFKDKNLKILDVQAGVYFAVVLAQDSQGKKSFYGVGKIEHTFYNNYYNQNNPPTPDQQTVNRFGNNAKVLYGKAIYQIVDVDAEQVAAYAATKNSVAYVLKGGQKQQPSIVPSKPEATGLNHFYKMDGVWNFVTADEYEKNKDTLPRLSFATRHPIKDFSSKNFADLSALDHQLSFSVQADTAPEYYCKYTVSEEDNEIKFVTATEKQALEGGCVQDMNPIIYIRSSKPAENARDVIPLIKLTDFFEQVQSEEAIAFNIVKTVVTEADLAPIEVKDEKSKVFLEEVKNFTSAQDNILISQIDKLAQSKSQTAITIKTSTIEPSEFTWAKDSALAKKDESILKLRCKLLLKLVKSWSTLESISDLQDKEIPGTIGNMLFTYKYLVPPSVLSKIVDQACDSIYESSGASVSVSRRKAFAFQDGGKIDHEGKYSIFGQIIQQISQERPDMSNFRIKSTDGKCYSISFKGEGSIDAGGPFRESLTNIATELEQGVVPLLIRSPNNKNEHGTNRDCFILDSRSKTPAHKFMFKYFGGFLAYAFLSKSPIPFNLAPWVWKQILQEEVTISDLDGIDAYSAQVLRDLKDHAQNLSDEHFDAGVDQYFTTVLSTGEEIPLCPEGETIKVTKSNIDEFCKKVLEARTNEAKEQVEAIRLGFLTVIQNNEAILNFCDWETLERRCTGEKIISVERLKSITTFNVGADNPIVARFWRVFEAFSEIEKRNYLKFVWGRCRLPIDLQNLSRRHEVRLFPNLSNTGFPQSHTCFFQLDLPDYQTDEMMSKRLATACELCGEIDTDNNAAQDLD